MSTTIRGFFKHTLFQDPNQQFGVPNQKFLSSNNQAAFRGESFAGQSSSRGTNQPFGGENQQFPNFGGRVQQNQPPPVRGESQLKEINGFKIPSQISASTPGQPGCDHNVLTLIVSLGQSLSLFEQIRNRVQGQEAAGGEQVGRREQEEDERRREFEALLAEKRAKEEELKRVKVNFLNTKLAPYTFFFTRRRSSEQQRSWRLGGWRPTRRERGCLRRRGRGKPHWLRRAEWCGPVADEADLCG